MEIIIYKTEEELLSAFANYFINTAQNAIDEHGLFNVVLAGGNSPKKIYQLLASPLFSDQIDWSKLFFFFGDERYVPFNDLENNANMVQQTLFDPLKIAAENIFKMNTSLSPEECAATYIKDISNHFKGKEIHFDLVILGLGENVHTASLFPYHSVLTKHTATVKEIYLEEENRYRITMTAPLISAAHEVAFLVYGENKAKAVRHVIKNEKNIQKYPAQLIQPANGNLKWFLDEKAASDLEKN